MCSCDSGSVYEIRSSANNIVLPGDAVLDYTNFKPPGLASIKNPAGSVLDIDLVQTNPWANRWWIKFYFMFKHYAGERTYYGRPVLSVYNNYGLQCYFQLIPVATDQYSLTIVTGRKYGDGPDHIEVCRNKPMVEGVWYEIIVGVTHSIGDGWWEIWIDGVDNVFPSVGVECGLFGIGDPRSRCCICGIQGCVAATPLIIIDGAILAWQCLACCCCGTRCEYPLYLCRFYHITNQVFWPGCSRGDCPCDNTQDACYPRRQTQFGASNFANRLLFGNEEGGSAAFDYWFDDIIFNDQAPYKHDNHAVADTKVTRPPFGSRLTLLKIDAIGDVADFVPIGSPNNWENVDELPVSLDDYNKSGTLNAKDLYNIEPAADALS